MLLNGGNLNIGDVNFVIREPLKISRPARFYFVFIYRAVQAVINKNMIINHQ